MYMSFSLFQVHDKFIKALITNIKKCFPDVGLLSALMIFDPARVPALEDCDDNGDKALEVQKVAASYRRNSVTSHFEWQVVI